MNTTGDELTPGDGRCSLREALGAVNKPPGNGDCKAPGGGANSIKLGPLRYRLTRAGSDETGNSTGDLNIRASVANLTIAGASVRATTIDATGLGDRVVSVAAGASATLMRLTLTGGRAPAGPRGPDGTSENVYGGAGGDGENGGAIVNDGSLVVSAAAVRGNGAGRGGDGGNGLQVIAGGPGGPGGVGGNGGGILNAGTLQVIATTIGGNAAGRGGDAGATPDSVIDAGSDSGSGNDGGWGGGIYNAGALTVRRSTISGNFGGDGGNGTNGGSSGGGGSYGGAGGGRGGDGGDGGWGGGILNIGYFGVTLAITNTTIASNFAGAGGDGGKGGAASADPNGNKPGGDGGSGGDGGAGGSGGGLGDTIFGGAQLLNVTVTDNARGGGGRAAAGGAFGTGTPNGSPGAAGTEGAAGDGSGIAGNTALQNTIVADNGGGGNCFGTMTPAGPGGGHDLVFGDATCPGINANPKLGPLHANGGPTATVALLPGSAAINKVPKAGAGCPPTDERGLPRPHGVACEIGAFEFARPVVAIKTPQDGAHVKQGKRVLASFSCAEGGLKYLIASCAGKVANGHPIGTATPGTKSFTVTALDKAGNRVSKTVHYVVTT